MLAHPPNSWAVADVPTVINNLRNWIVGLLTGLATLFLTFGGLRYLMAGGDPGEVEAAKRALKAAAIGYGLAILAPVLVTVLQGIVGAGT
nr:pilin [Streptomyces sp. WM6378]